MRVTSTTTPFSSGISQEHGKPILLTFSVVVKSSNGSTPVSLPQTLNDPQMNAHFPSALEFHQSQRDRGNTFLTRTEDSSPESDHNDLSYVVYGITQLALYKVIRERFCHTEHGMEEFRRPSLSACRHIRADGIDSEPWLLRGRRHSVWRYIDRTGVDGNLHHLCTATPTSDYARPPAQVFARAKKI